MPFEYLGKLSEDTGATLPSELSVPATATRSGVAETPQGSSSFLASSIHHPQSAVEEFSQLFASHEAWFKAATSKRQEVYSALRAEASDVLKSLRESEAKSGAVLARISELGKLVAQERSKYERG